MLEETELTTAGHLHNYSARPPSLGHRRPVEFLVLLRQPDRPLDFLFRLAGEFSDERYSGPSFAQLDVRPPVDYFFARHFLGHHFLTR